MARYIDADEPIKTLKRWFKYPDYNKGEQNIIACVITMLEETPTADVVEVVRCKDCVFYDGNPCGIVDWWNSNNDFCSKAKRREE